MKSALFSTAVCLGLAVGGAASAATQDLGTLGLGFTWFGNAFDTSTTNFTDYYTFKIGSGSDVSGTTFELDIGSLYNVDLSSIQLFAANNPGAVLGADSTPTNGFSFKNVSAGNYTLAVAGNVTGAWGGSYLGAIQAIATPVPEPEDFALTLLGLIGVGVLMSRARTGAAV